jgi:glycosyltransferase involved in cell wall biosynthesis
VKRALVVLDALMLRPRPTGVGRAILDWTLALAEHGTDHDVAVLCTHPEMFAHVAGRPRWRLVPCPGARGGTLREALWTQLVMPGLLRRLGADLLHCLQFVAPLRAPCPTVVTVYDLGYRLYPRTTEQPRRGYYQLFVPRSLRAAAAVACISQATADDVLAAFPELAGRVHVTPLGVPTWVHDQPPFGTARDAAAPFLFVGTLEPRKNLERLLLAYEAFRQERRRDRKSCPQLVLVGGRGWQDSGLRHLLGRLTAEGGVVVRDYCSQDELWRQYGLARALLLPSLHEGFGLPILEAMAAGVPVLTSDRGVMAEVAGDAALLVDPLDGDALREGLRRLVDDADLIRSCVERGRRNLARWTWSRNARATGAIYAAILAGRRPESSPGRST